MTNPYNANPYSFGQTGTGNNYASYRTNDYNNFGGNRAGDPYVGNTINQQLPQMNTLPQQPLPQSVGLKGRMVTREEDITAGEIPMDNTLSLFPLADYSCIYAKQWQPNGTIATVKYVPEVQVQETKEVTTSGEVDLDELYERLGNIEHMLRKQQRPRKSNYRKNQNGSNFNKKEVDNA